MNSNGNGTIKVNQIQRFATKLGSDIGASLQKLAATAGAENRSLVLEKSSQEISVAMKTLLEKCIENSKCIWIVESYFNHPSVKVVPRECIDLWVEESVGKGEHGLLVNPLTGTVLFIASYKDVEEDGGELYVSAKRCAGDLWDDIVSLQRAN
ncbi:MAG: hypothetical protein AB7P37_11915 [Ramlibacter sp.]